MTLFPLQSNAILDFWIETKDITQSSKDLCDLPKPDPVCVGKHQAQAPSTKHQHLGDGREFFSQGRDILLS